MVSQQTKDLLVQPLFQRRNVMTKKLFVVLVVVAAMLLAFSWAIAAKKAVKGYPQKVEMPEFTAQQAANAMPKAVAGLETSTALDVATGHAQKSLGSAVPVAGVPVPLGEGGGKDFCDLMGSAYWFFSGWLWGLEYYANYQDPELYGCTAVWPFDVTEIDIQLNFPAEWVEAPVYVQGFVFADYGTPECPEPEPTPGFICSTAVYGYTIPAGGGYFELPMYLEEECCVYQPYFAVVYIHSDLNGLDVDLVTEDGDVPCRSYNDYGSGWGDLSGSAPGPLMLYSRGYTSPQNECPTEGDTCGVMSVTPDLIEVLAGGTAEFTANVYFTGTQTECLLTVTPDPACPSCVTTIDPNPVVSPATSATVTIVTDPSTPVGDYVFDVGGSKASATVRVLEPSDECVLARDDGSISSYFSGYRVGDQNAMLMDPEEMCVQCGPDVYPFKVEQVSVRMYDFAAVGGVDVIFHLYEAPEPYCDGPGAEIYSFEATVTTFYPEDFVTFDLPEAQCVNGPFWLALEYNSGVEGEIPCLLMDAQDYEDTCTQFNWRFYDPDWLWREWADFWTPPTPGYLTLRGAGHCNSPCPEQCDMAQDNGSIASYASWIMEGFKLAKYYDPEDYCQEPVYPYFIHDVDMLFYDFGTVGEVNIEFGVSLVCHDSCDGPGTQIYASDTYNITTMYPDMVHIVFDEPICVFEPFFITATWKPGPSPFPSFLIDNNAGIPGDSCHAWFWYVGASPPWIEHWDLWGTPADVGMPIFRVSGFTNHPECEQAPCEDPLEMLWGGLYAYYYWQEPENDPFINMMFQMPLTNPGRLDAVEIAWYASGTIGTPDPDVYVWLSDGTFPLDNNPPYQAIAEFHVANDDLVFYPTYYYIDTHEMGMMFDPGEKFHVGGSHAHEAGDTLAWLSDDGAYESERGSSWDGSAWASFYPYEFLINAYVCLYEPPESTFTLECSPFLAPVTPGDPPVKKFTVDVGAILGYSLNVNLSCTPPTGFTVSFDPPNGIPPFTSDVYVSVDAGTPYDDYTLTLCGTGDDAQMVCCDVKARVQPAYDEVDVPFYHGSQLATNFGAVGNDTNNDNFLWYGITGQQFDGSFIVATDNVHMALDVYNCEHWGWVPSQHIDCYYDAQYNANVCYGDFYCDELEPGIPGVPGEHDSVFIVGIMEECVDFSIKIKVYYNDGPDPIEDMYISLFEDWDIGEAYVNHGDLDPDHNLAYQYDPVDPDIVFGMMKAPYYDEPLYNMWVVPNYRFVWPNSGFCDDAEGWWGLDSLYWMMTQPGYFYQAGPDSDLSLMQTAGPINLPVGEKHIEVWIDFGRNLTDGLDWSQWRHRVLRYAGFYRGDVNASDTLELPALDVSDLVYLIQYLFQNGPAPVPYADQGDVDKSGCGGGEAVNVGDVVYLLNYIFLDGPPPIDYVRFIPQCWPRESLFLNPDWQ
jgi:hypothetical protein